MEKIVKIVMDWQFTGGDLAREILLRLPVKSVLRFRCVCRQWLQITSDPEFRRSHALRHPHPAIEGFIEVPLTPRPPNGFRSYSVSGVPFPSFCSIVDNDEEEEEDENPGVIFLDHSCNGLLVYKKFQFIDQSAVTSLHVRNPTTKEQRSIPYPDFIGAHSFALAFDPSCRPLVYTIVCIEKIWIHDGVNDTYQIWIYSCETGGLWRRSGEPIPYEVLCYLNTRSATFSGGALHWMRPNDLFVFHVKDERWHTTPLPCTGDSYGKHWRLGELQGGVHYFEYIDHLHFLNIFRMKEDYAGWSVVCRLHLDFLSVSPSRCRYCSIIDKDEDRDGEEDRRKNHLLLGRHVTFFSPDFKKEKKKGLEMIPGLLPFIHPAFTSKFGGKKVVPCAPTLFSP